MATFKTHPFQPVDVSCGLHYSAASKEQPSVSSQASVCNASSKSFLLPTAYCDLYMVEYDNTGVVETATPWKLLSCSHSLSVPFLQLFLTYDACYTWLRGSTVGCFPSQKRIWTAFSYHQLHKGAILPSR